MQPGWNSPAALGFGTPEMSDLWQVIHALTAREGMATGSQHGTPLAERVLSLPDVARQHADAHRWLESERHGRDVGPTAYTQWRQRYWRTFCRWRYLEHILGVCCYREFDRRRFGSLRQQEAWSLDEAMDFALRRMLRDDREQVEVLYEAPDTLPRQRLLQVLGLLDVNGARVSPPDWAMLCAESQA